MIKILKKFQFQRNNVKHGKSNYLKKSEDYCDFHFILVGLLWLKCYVCIKRIIISLNKIDETSVYNIETFILYSVFVSE